MFKKVLFIVGLAFIGSSFSHADVSDTVIIAISQSKTKSSIRLTNTIQDSDIKLRDTINIGTVGTKINGEDIQGDNIEQYAYIRARDAIMVGDVGSIIGH